MTDAQRLTFVVVADVGPDGVEAFQRYEAGLLPLLGRYQGRVERRLRTASGQTEVHVVSFASRSGYEGYLADPLRTAQRGVLDGVPLTQRLLEVTDVGADQE